MGRFGFLRRHSPRQLCWRQRKRQSPACTIDDQEEEEEEEEEEDDKAAAVATTRALCWSLL